MTDSSTASARRSALFKAILGPEKSFYWLAAVYSIATSVLGLAVPLSVQVLIATVSNTALLQPVVVLALILFGLLGMYGALYVVQAHLMDRFERRFFARYTQEIVLRSVHSAVAPGRRMNREELANRFFEIVSVQRNVPTIVLNGSAILMQAIVGIIVVSAYHPAFMVFSLVLIRTTVGRAPALCALDKGAAQGIVMHQQCHQCPFKQLGFKAQGRLQQH